MQIGLSSRWRRGRLLNSNPIDSGLGAAALGFPGAGALAAAPGAHADRAGTCGPSRLRSCAVAHLDGDGAVGAHITGDTHGLSPALSTVPWRCGSGSDRRVAGALSVTITTLQGRHSLGPRLPGSRFRARPMNARASVPPAKFLIIFLGVRLDSVLCSLPALPVASGGVLSCFFGDLFPRPPIGRLWLK